MTFFFVLAGDSYFLASVRRSAVASKGDRVEIAMKINRIDATMELSEAIFPDGRGWIEISVFELLNDAAVG